MFVIKQFLLKAIKEARKEGFNDATNIWAGKNLKKVIELSGTIEQAKADQRSEIVEKEKERQYELLMSCLPKDAENLSTLTSDQAKRLINCFIKKNPWD